MDTILISIPQNVKLRHQEVRTCSGSQSLPHRPLSALPETGRFPCLSTTLNCRVTAAVDSSMKVKEEEGGKRKLSL